MLTRRDFLKNSAILATALSMKLSAKANREFYMPSEEQKHKQTFMAFGASKQIWGNHLFREVQRNLATLANTISDYERVSILVRESDLRIAKKLLSDSVNILVFDIDDLWIRDTGSTFVLDEAGEKYGIDFNFNGWGEKQEYSKDAKVARFITKEANAKLIKTNIILEGGSIEVDGEGTAIMTESSILNDNRNPNMSKAKFESIIKPLLGLDKIIWLKGVKGKDITDAHVDFYARFAKVGSVIAGYDSDPYSYDHKITKENIEVLKSSTDAKGRKLNITTLQAPSISKIRKEFLNNDFAGGYIGFYVCNDAVIMQNFGDKRADSEAKEKVANLFPDRDIIDLNVDGISAGGGSIHCATQQEIWV